jgi:cytoskeleton protein RodZ
MAGEGGEEDRMESEETQGQASPGVGEQLRRAREAMGRSCADLAEELRLTEDQIRALEEEDFSHLPAEAYVRGYLRNYAASVGLAPEVLIEAYERQSRGGGQAAHPEDESPLIPEPERPLIEHPWRVVWISLALVAAVSGVTMWLLGQEEEAMPPVAQGEGQAQEGQEAETPEGEAEAPEAPTGPEGPETASPETSTPPEGGADAEKTAKAGGSEAPGDEPTAGASSPGAEVPQPGSGTESGPDGQEGSAPAEEAGAPSEAMPTVPPAPGPEPVEEQAGATQGAEERQVLRIHTWADAWLEVADDRGNLLLQRLVPADRDLRLHGQAPFQVKAGNAAGVQLYFEGKPLAPLGDPGEVVRVNVDGDSATIPESEVAPPPGLSPGEGEGGSRSPDSPSGPENGED